MSSIWIGYNISVTTFSPDGCIFQFEYASKIIDNGGFVSLVPTVRSFFFSLHDSACWAVGGIKCKDAIVLVIDLIIAGF
jgi:20S proteasome alpha/beta subunit